MADIRYKPVSHDHEAFLKKAAKRKGFKKAYAEREEEYRLTREMLAARSKFGLTQETVAERMGTTKSAVSRLESAGNQTTCNVANRSIKTIAADGAVTCEDDDNSGGTVTNIATGAGLTGGPITGTGTISLNTTSINVANCISGTGTGKIYWDATNNRLACGTDQLGAGITGAGTDNYLSRWNGTGSLETSNIYQTDTGNIGIGTGAVANQRLEVNGTAQAATFYASTGVSTFNTTVAAGTVESNQFCESTARVWRLSTG